jgi:DNA-binding NarL/FixJ family response regulator
MNNLLNVLIADDSPFIIERIKTILSDLDMVNVIGEAHNGNEVTDFLKTEIPDVVLLDVIMPGINGMDVLSYIKKEYAGVQVIMLTNQANPYTRKLCMNLGASYFFDKSTEFEKLPEALEQLSAAKKDLVS